MDSENLEQPLLASQEEQQEETFHQLQPHPPHPPQDEQNQQYPLTQIPAQNCPQQQRQDCPQQAEMQPPPYSGPAHTTQPMPYSSYAQQPQVAQPTHLHRNTTVVVTGGAVAQPQYVYHGFPAESYMALSILTCLFCFCPVGIAAIIKSSEVGNCLQGKNSEGYTQQPVYNPQQQQLQSYPPSQPHPPQNEQLQQGHPPQNTEQSYPQMAPPPYCEQPQTTQPVSYTTCAQQPMVMQPTNSQNTTVVVAGGVVPQSAPIYHGPPPESYMLFSILTCLFCFWPVSIVAIVRSSEVNSANAAGDYFRAKFASESAKRLNITSMILGISVSVAFVFYMVFVYGLGRA